MNQVIKKAELVFSDILDAEDFARSWKFHSKRGHSIGSGIRNVKVTIYDVTEREKEWVDLYVSKL